MPYSGLFARYGPTPNAAGEGEGAGMSGAGEASGVASDGTWNRGPAACEGEATIAAIRSVAPTINEEVSDATFRTGASDGAL